ncbi:hypothetical protein TREMEDRAFT_40458 [Tremella mesenterica DSM 1558]|uniref:uncharacterized protein n=1 Tax=Tremella mesenterica (strain ATCC 24925 / CBS 8224 / DSM 1558 / NBRC 9311 / NRRL Y-6157 / RJB 2259-6 / UBC 559-6) TaxID=578456 RepID=UPI0003F49B43|nr:uncharacterized protein TREMEDRAFT_40458 [Tremella mesenterica DSM 1558]EIW67303.1 hypothetical protein TREMEDRAFT_40458 [Tremella mesenterica DSM 1558]
MGLLSGSMESLSIKGKSRRDSDASGSSRNPPDGNPDDTSTLDKEEGNVLMSIISQLRPGMDLSKIALPTFVLEPRSLLERITDFFSHPELIFGVGEEDDPKQRFLAVMTFYLSGWHIKPKGVKKPYNPVLGEFFRCTYFYADGSEGFYVAEQVSHHPPVSAFFYVSPKNRLLITGELKPKSKFLGNSAATIMEGEDRIRLLDRPGDGDYVITMPNTYARGILFGKMILELGDLSTIANPQTGYTCDVEFKTKGWISGGYNVINGRVKGPGKTDVGEVTGHWHSTIEYGDKGAGKKQVMFDSASAKIAPKAVLPESEQEEYESRRLWAKLTTAINSADMYGATAAKTAVEDKQRELAKKREVAGESLPPSRFFTHVEGDKWMPKIGVDTLPKDPIEMEEAVRKWIFGDHSPTLQGTPSRSPTTSTRSGATQATPVPVPPVGPALATSSGVVSPPASSTAPGPPKSGPKYDHPVGTGS